METPRDIDTTETREWQEALDDVIAAHGEERASFLLQRLLDHAYRRTVPLPAPTTPYVNTIPASEQPPFPGDREIERRIKSIIRWNAMAMVVRANQRARRASAGTSRPTPRRRPCTRSASTTSSAAAARAASAATWSTSRATPRPASTPAPSSKGRLTEQQLENFRRELRARRRAVVLSAPLADAGLLGVPDRVDGPRPDHRRSTRRASTATCEDRGLADTGGPQGLGLPRRRRDGRAGDARRHHPGRAREARQPDLRRQLQPAAPRRPGARQRQDHPGARGRLPRRRLERHQGDLGRRLGSAARSATTTACWSSA